MQGRHIKRNRLNDRQKMFCLCYLRYHSAIKAYQKAYHCSHKNAHHNSWHLMAQQPVQDYLKHLEKKVSHGEFMTTMDVIHQWAKAVYADMSDYATWNYKKGHNNLHFKPSNEVDGTLIQSIRTGKNGPEITLIDKNKALEDLMDVLPKPISRSENVGMPGSLYYAIAHSVKVNNHQDRLKRENQQLKRKLDSLKRGDRHED